MYKSLILASVSVLSLTTHARGPLIYIYIYYKCGMFNELRAP